MLLLEKIKKDQIIARKEGHKKIGELLTTLFSEASMVGKNNGNRESTDEEVIATVKKFIKNINETKNNVQLSEMQLYELDSEIELYEKYIPKQFDENELKEIVNKLIEENGISKEPRQMGVVMGLLKSKFFGQFDGKIASGIVKDCLS